MTCDFEQLPDIARAEAHQRAMACMAVQRLIDAGSTQAAAVAEIAKAESLSPLTLRNRFIRVHSLPQSEWAPTLASQRGRHLQKKRAAFSDEAWDYLRADYLRNEAPCISACYDRLLRIAPSKNWQIPSYRTVVRRLEVIDWKVRTLAREGDDALLKKLPHVTRTRGHLCAMQMVNADGHKLDLLCKLPSGVVGRPQLTVWQDLYSGKLLSWRMSETLNWHHVRLSFGDMIERYGVPREVFLDNGKEFNCKLISGGAKFRFRFKIKEPNEPLGLFAQLGVQCHFTTPYHGQSKPIERAFRDLCETIAKHPQNAGAYTGNSPVTKPANYGSRHVQWDDLLALVDSEIAAHNARTGRRTAVAKGRSFDRAFEESYVQSTVTRATPDQRRLFLLAAEGVTVRSTGHVGIMQNIYWGEALPPLAGKHVVVRFDPEHLERPVFVYDNTGVLMCEASRTVAAFDDADAAKEFMRANRQKIKATREVLKAERRMTALEAAAMLNVGQPPSAVDPDSGLTPGVTRLIFPPRRAAVNDADYDIPISDETRRQESNVLNHMDTWAKERFAL